MKEILLSTPILAYDNFTKLFKLHTDACILGLGAILYQNQDGIDRVIDYVSRTLSKTEHKYPANMLKLLAWKWAMTK